ncbi:MAG: DUF4388 domain-containing protein [Actinobacteria bacterium]|nr:DUF4388 domain-containing protein [Actinomycetota bacterium]MCZ6567363.1 DUF4388 domain-containing protein [Actinomycetota bacterium]MCZ6630167.1 DUF4388 domain-containing protein [Actinomycetota bacterium]
MEGQMHLSGQLADWSINDLLQIMQVTDRTGSLDIAGDRRGRIHFRDGMVTGAELIGARETNVANDRGGAADIVYVLSTLETGSFSVGAADGPDTSGWSVEDILADVDALKSLEGEVIDAGLLQAAGIRFGSEIEEPITISPDHWAILVSVMPPFTFDDLETKMGRVGAVRVLHTLHQLGVADVITEEDESDWLDRVADDVAPVSDDPIWLEDVPEETKGKAGASAEETSASEAPAEKALVAAADDAAPKSGGKKAKAAEIRGVSAPASTTLTDGVYDEIRRLRSKVAEK